MSCHTIKEIQLVVCRHFGLERDRLLGNSRNRGVARPRQIAMYLCRLRTKQSLPQIGMAFYRDHSTVYHATKRIVSLMGTNPKILAHVMDCEEMLASVEPWKVGAAKIIAEQPLVQELEAA